MAKHEDNTVATWLAKRIGHETPADDGSTFPINTSQIEAMGGFQAVALNPKDKKANLVNLLKCVVKTQGQSPSKDVSDAQRPFYSVAKAVGKLFRHQQLRIENGTSFDPENGKRIYLQTGGFLQDSAVLDVRDHKYDVCIVHVCVENQPRLRLLDILRTVVHAEALANVVHKPKLFILKISPSNPTITLYRINQDNLRKRIKELFSEEDAYSLFRSFNFPAPLSLINRVLVRSLHAKDSIEFSFNKLEYELKFVVRDLKESAASHEWPEFDQRTADFKTPIASISGSFELELLNIKMMYAHKKVWLLKDYEIKVFSA